MKNATKYEKKIKKHLAGMKKCLLGDAPQGQEAVSVLVKSVFQADADEKDAHAAVNAITEEVVNFNELRVCPVRDILDCIGKDFPDGSAKIAMVTAALNGVFQRTSDVSIDYMADMAKRDLRRHLDDLGLNPYAAACVVLLVFGGHAIPVDDTLVEVLKMDGYVDPDSDVLDVQGFLTRIISQKDALSAHEFFRAYIAKSANALAKKRKAEALVRAKAEAEALKKAARAAKVAEKKAAAAKKAKSKAAKKKVKKKASKKVAAKKSTKKVVKKKAAKKVAKKATKRATKKATKKAAKKATGKKSKTGRK